MRIKFVEVLLSVSAICLGLIPISASSQQASPALASPAGRYMGHAPGGTIIIHWGQAIVPTILGVNQNSKTAMEALASLLFYARAAGAAVDFGDNAPIAAKGNMVNKNSNYVILFSDEIPAYNRLFSDSKTSALGVLGVDPSLGSESLKALTGKRLIRQGRGCYEQLSLNQDAQVQAMMLVVDKSLNEDDREACFDAAIISSFGLDPVVSHFHLKVDPSSDVAHTFVNDSEIILALEAANYCRVKWHDANASCPRKVINDVLSEGPKLELK